MLTVEEVLELWCEAIVGDEPGEIVRFARAVEALVLRKRADEVVFAWFVDDLPDGSMTLECQKQGCGHRFAQKDRLPAPCPQCKTLLHYPPGASW